jgi:glycerate kinase
MHILAVSQALKQTLSLHEVTRAMAAGIQSAGATPLVVEGSDGGDGLLDALAERLRAQKEYTVPGPLGRPVTVPVGWLDPLIALIESRLVCGLDLVPMGERDPERATTRGLGELILAVERAGAQRAYVGLGGSATVDGGDGLAEAWEGCRPTLDLVGLCDVTVPLGGALRFAPQKGADSAMVARLGERLSHLAAGHPDAARMPGAGAAGGLGFGLVVHGDATLVSGADWVLDRAGFDTALADADLVIVTEGAFDDTSRLGKLTGTVLDRAHAAGCPAAIVAPTVTDAPAGVLVETGGGRWTAAILAERVAALVRRVSET